MADVIVNDGRDLLEQKAIDSNYSAVLDTVAVGDGTQSPSLTDSSLTNNLYEASSSNSNVTAEKDAGVGEMRFTIAITGDTEVPGGSDITEIGVKASDGTLFYYEVRDTAITVSTGETVTIEVVVQLEDADPGESSTAIVDEGLDKLANIVLGNSSERVDTIAVGDSTNNVSQTDTSMFSEVHRASASDSYVDISTTTTVGKPEFLITLSAGSDASDEVSGGTDVSEFGLIVSGSNTLLLHETRNTVTLETNDSKTFSIPLNITQ